MSSRKRKRGEIEGDAEIEEVQSESKTPRLDASPKPCPSSECSSLERIDSIRDTLRIEDAAFDDEIRKYWHQRYLLFSKFDEGILLDKVLLIRDFPPVGWYSVTPEAIAAHTAKRFLQALGPRAIVVDAMCGVGGNAIQFAQYFRVIAIDLSEERLKIAHHNANVYGVAHNIEFIQGDFLELAPSLDANAVFLSPPWGGPGYAFTNFDLNSIGGFEIFEAALNISPNIAYYLPRNVDDEQLEVLAAMAGGTVEKETCYLNSRLKAITAYFGILAGSDYIELDAVEEYEDDFLNPRLPSVAPFEKKVQKERSMSRQKES